MKDNVYQRIKQIIEDKGLSVRQFERLCDFSNRYVKSLEKSSPTLESLEKILATFPDVDRHWLLTGEWEDKGRVEETRPRIPTSVAAGSLMGFADAIKSYDCEMQPVVKNFPTYDYTIIIKGDSMEPKFEGGDEGRRIRQWVKSNKKNAFYVVEHKIENGKYSVGLDILAVIAEALDARVELISPSTTS